MDAARGWATARRELASFDGGLRGVEEVARPDRYRLLEQVPEGRRRIVRGGGYSYAAASFGHGALVQDCRAFDRVLEFDTQSGLLRCEAGTPLGKVYALAARHGWYLAVQPGYPAITVGGCVAADVHGKNQYADGNFRNVVRSLRLFHPRHGVKVLSREAEPALFELTCGGFGLTGQILDVSLQLARLPGARVCLRRERLTRFEDTLALLEARAPQVAFQYTWHDLGGSGDRFGRGYLYSGDFLPGSLPSEATPRVVAIDAGRRGRGLPVSLLNRATTRWFNRAYGLLQALEPPEREAGLFDFLFPVARRVVYFDLFGRPGFHEYQLLVPRESFEALAAALRELLRHRPTPVTLASCKLFRGEQTHLRFDGSGLCLALDFPRGAAGSALAAQLDQLLPTLGAVPNVMKDSRLPRGVVQACFPGYERFASALRQFDPERLYASELSERLGL